MGLDQGTEPTRAAAGAARRGEREHAAAAAPGDDARIGTPVPAGLCESFALETRDGLIFTVKGDVQPPGRTVAYLRYVPDPEGERHREGARYRRVYAFADQVRELEARGHRYFVDDPVFGVRLQGVPHADVARVYDPRRRLEELRADDPEGPVQLAALELCRLLADAAHLAPGDLGVTGSLLVSLDWPASDVDVVVFGDAPSRAAHQALAELAAPGRSSLRLPGTRELAAMAASHRADTPLTDADFARHQLRKVNEGSVGGRPFFVRFVKLPTEAMARYGDPRYETLGRATITAVVDDARDSIFTPCAYGVRDVIVEKGVASDRLAAVVSFRGRFSDQARQGERVHARGTVERVTPASGDVTTRLTVGGDPGDFLAAEAP